MPSSLPTSASLRPSLPPLAARFNPPQVHSHAPSVLAIAHAFSLFFWCRSLYINWVLIAFLLPDAWHMLSTLRRRPCFALRASPGTMILTTLRHMFPTQTIVTILWESSVQSLSRSVYLPATLLPYGILNAWCQKRSSSKRKDIFAQIQRIRQKNSDLSLDPSIRDVTLGLLLDMPIRWSSTYVMLARALDLREVSFGLSLEMRNSVAEAHNMISGCSTVCV